jgi:OmpA-OmpF porin, OOP family
MRSSALLVVALGGSLAACATPEAKALCYPVSGWATPVFRCAAEAPKVAEAPPEPPPPEPAPEPEPAAPPPRAELKEESIELSETVQFETGSDVLLDRSKQLLDDVAQTLIDHPEITKIQIEGHTDSVASRRLNRKLSQERIASVRKYLISKGVDGSRLSVKAFGEAKPTASNKTDEGRAQNRRVEFKILKRK